MIDHKKRFALRERMCLVELIDVIIAYHYQGNIRHTRVLNTKSQPPQSPISNEAKKLKIALEDRPCM